MYDNSIFAMFFVDENIIVNNYDPVKIEKCNLKLLDSGDETESEYSIIYGNQRIVFSLDDEIFSIYFFKGNIRSKAVKNKILDEYVFLIEQSDGFDSIKSFHEFVSLMFTYLINLCE